MKLSKNNPHADMLKQFEEWFGSCFASVLVVTINSKTVSRSRRYPVPCHLQTLNTFTSLRNKIFIFPLFKISKLSQPVNFCYWACLYFNINICISFSGTLFISLFIYLFNFYAHLLNYLLRLSMLSIFFDVNLKRDNEFTDNYHFSHFDDMPCPLTSLAIIWPSLLTFV